MKKIIGLLAVVCSSAFAQDVGMLKPENQEALSVFAKSMLDEDASGFIKGHDSAFSDYIPTITASKLISEYQDNELSADKKYKDKPVRIKTVASAIKSDIGGRGFIVANGSNAYSHAYLYIDEKDERILSLKKGGKIDFICFGNEMTLNTPMLRPCLFTSDFTKSMVSRIEKNIGRASESVYKPQSQLEVAVLIGYKIFEPEIADSCIKSIDDCIKAVGVASNVINKGKGKNSQDTIKALQEEAGKYKDLPPLPIDKKTALLKLFE